MSKVVFVRRKYVFNFWAVQFAQNLLELAKLALQVLGILLSPELGHLHQLVQRLLQALHIFVKFLLDGVCGFCGLL